MRLGSLLPVGALLTSAFCASAQTWVNTKTQAVAPSLVNATALGVVAANTPLHIAVALQLPNTAALQDLVRHQNTPGDPLYQTELTPEQFVASYAPSAAAVQQVVSYLGSQGFTNVSAESNRLFVTADATAAQVNAAFNTQLQQFSQAGRTIFANVSAAQVPASLGGTVLSVLGLNNAAVMHKNLVLKSNATPNPALPVGVPNYLVSYTPPQLQKAYDVGPTPTGSRTPIAIFAEGDLTQVLKDLRTAELAHGQPQVPTTVVPVGISSPDTAGADEWDLDTQLSTGMAQSVSRLYIYDTTSLTDSDVALMFNKFASQKLAKAGSASFGLCEFFAFLDGSMLADDQVFLQAASQGQTVFASSGDTGAPDQEYPASSPYVVAVGGTTLLTNADGSYNAELAWNAGGGGPAELEGFGYWQNGVVPATAVGKGVPDIAMDADPESGAEVYVNGAPEGIGGTSLSSPMALGVWARFESAHGNKLGFASPLLYQKLGSAGFHDIILGTNGLWAATPGWDYTTGLGTFDIAQMNGIIGK
jgi:pseudomonalisin